MNLTKMHLPPPRPQQTQPSRRSLTATAAASLIAILALTSCGAGKAEKASQTAVKVNKEEITVHQINFVMQRQQGLKPEQAEAASKQILERLIDQELAVQKAAELKLDRDPAVVQQIENAKREILARAYVDRIGETVTKPSAAELSQYYNDKPALFKDRRIFSLQEISIEAKPEQAQQIRAKLQTSKSMAEFAEYLKANEFRFTGNQAVRAAEQLPMAGLEAIAAMKDGDSAVSQTPTGLNVLFLVSSRLQPVAEPQARQAIETFLSNQRKGELVQKDIKALRTAAQIQYVGKFKEGVAELAQAAAPAAPPPPPPNAGSLDASAISKGMGIKQ